MKKIIFTSALALTVLGHSEENPYFFYSDTYTMGALPLLGAGVRAQKGIHAFDFSGNAFPINPQIFHFKALYLAYPQQKGFYIGAGVGILNEPETVKVSGSFEGTIGYQWNNRIFLEANAVAPFKQSEALIPVWPGLTVGIGF